MAKEDIGIGRYYTCLGLMTREDIGIGRYYTCLGFLLIALAFHFAFLAGQQTGKKVNPEQP